jgi:dihydrolipoamide dehydrogenase
MGSGKLDRRARRPSKVSRSSGGSPHCKAKNVILATGARARDHPGIGIEPDGERIWSYRDAMVPAEMPKSLLVIGSGAIGIEFASFYRALGAEVTVVEAGPGAAGRGRGGLQSLCPQGVREAGHEIPDRRGKVKKVNPRRRTASPSHHRGRRQGIAGQLTCRRVIVAVGIVGNTEGHRAGGAGVKSRPHPCRDRRPAATGEPGLYAIGDVAGPPWLAHKASHEGVICGREDRRLARCCIR